MQQFHHDVNGTRVTVNRVEHEEDLEHFRDFVRAHWRGLACDSEATGLDLYSPSFQLRLVQFGTPHESYVIPVEHGGKFIEDTCRALRGVQRLIFHNGGFDLQVFDQTLGVQMEELWPKATDTRILSHLVDPRGQQEGGIGHSLENLVRHYLDADLADNIKGLMAALAKKHGTTKKRIWSQVPLDDPTYNLYAGMDTLFTSRLFQILEPLVPASSRGLITYEHRVAEVCSYMERTGFLLDVDYAETLSAQLADEEARNVLTAREFGCENVNSTEQVADVLEMRGVEISGRTPTGKRKVDKKLLDGLAANGDEFAHAVTEAKKAHKWRSTWVDGFLHNRDSNNRCHPNINSLLARTARMSVTGIPAQTLPSGDWIIRRCFIADEGQTVAACDFQTQELRVLAALSGDRTMMSAFANGADLHQLTADAAGVGRKVGKTTNFAYVYGSGAKNIAESCNIDVPTARKVITGFEKSYPRVKELSKGLQVQASRDGYITTPMGRRLPVDANRTYSSLNYLVQSSSRDITAGALIRLHEAGFTPYMRLPVHDEVIASLPSGHAQWGAREMARIMATDFHGVHVGTDAEVYGFSWGHGYMSDEEKESLYAAA